MDIIQAIKEHKLIAIVRGIEADALARLVRALHAGGISLVEVTFDQARPGTWADTAQAIAMIDREFGGKVLPGAGTVLTPEQLALAAEAGARYIISPNIDEDVIAETRERGLVSIPGAYTPTEVVQAYDMGGHIVKLFPAGGLGPDYIRAVKAPLAHIPLMAVGGVTEQNAAAFLRAGAEGLGVGGNLVNREWIRQGEWGRIQAAAEAYAAAVADCAQG